MIKAPCTAAICLRTAAWLFIATEAFLSDMYTASARALDSRSISQFHVQYSTQGVREKTAFRQFDEALTIAHNIVSWTWVSIRSQTY